MPKAVADLSNVKKAMRAMANGRSVQPVEGAFELSEAQSGYYPFFDTENSDIDPKKV